jgi:hypothetical protein
MTLHEISFSFGCFPVWRTGETLYALDTVSKVCVFETSEMLFHQEYPC